MDENGRALLDWARRLITFRREHPVLHRRKFFQGQQIYGAEATDMVWYGCDGSEMTDDEWNTSWVRCFGVMLNGQAMDEWNEYGEHVLDDVLLVMMNAHHEVMQFKLPGAPEGPRWQVVFDTNTPVIEGERSAAAGEIFEIQPRSLALLRQPKEVL
jgi:glycogen operon protein